MATVEYKRPCDLCGQPVEIEGFTLITDKGEQLFCCAGCISIYKLLHGNTLTTSTQSSAIADSKSAKYTTSTHNYKKEDP